MNGTSIQTRSGNLFDFLNPGGSTILIGDIAASLSKLCRFVGQCNEFYSVAQHSYLVSCVCDPADALWGLLHDASEAYMGDCNGPLKGLIPDFKVIENSIQDEISKKFGLPLVRPRSVHVADRVMLATEGRDLFHGHFQLYMSPEIESHRAPIAPLTSAEAEGMFLARFNQLTKGKFK